MLRIRLFVTFFFCGRFYYVIRIKYRNAYLIFLTGLEYVGTRDTFNLDNNSDQTKLL